MGSRRGGGVRFVRSTDSRAGFTDRLVKPIDHDRLHALVMGHLEASNVSKRKASGSKKKPKPRRPRSRK
jgi:DNA-binding NtrC family response regulator